MKTKNSKTLPNSGITGNTDPPQQPWACPQCLADAGGGSVFCENGNVMSHLRLTRFELWVVTQLTGKRLVELIENDDFRLEMKATLPLFIRTVLGGTPIFSKHKHQPGEQTPATGHRNMVPGASGEQEQKDI